MAFTTPHSEFNDAFDSFKLGGSPRERDGDSIWLLPPLPPVLSFCKACGRGLIELPIMPSWALLLASSFRELILTFVVVNNYYLLIPTA